MLNQTQLTSTMKPLLINTLIKLEQNKMSTEKPKIDVEKLKAAKEAKAAEAKAKKDAAAILKAEKDAASAVVKAEKAEKSATVKAEKPVKEKVVKAEKPAKPAKVEQNGVVKPNVGTSGDLIWNLADELSAKKGETISSAEVWAEGEKLGWNKNNTVGWYHLWRKFNGLVGTRIADPNRPVKEKTAKPSKNKIEALETKIAALTKQLEELKAVQVSEEPAELEQLAETVEEPMELNYSIE